MREEQEKHMQKVRFFKTILSIHIGGCGSSSGFKHGITAKNNNGIN
jgi:hypothetical protein